MPPLKNLAGQRFGRLLVISRYGTSSYGQPIWLCECDCGKRKSVFSNALRSGATRSCGCLHREAISTHGATGTTEFTIWQMMRQRCNNPRTRDYARYGGRGIRVCRRWQEFSNFLADMGKRPSRRYTLDRIDNDGDYSPSNCRWATAKQQGASKSSAKKLTHNGETLTRREWSRRLGIPRTTLYNRLKMGWSVQRALSTPSRNRKQRVG